MPKVLCFGLMVDVRENVEFFLLSAPILHNLSTCTTVEQHPSTVWCILRIVPVVHSVGSDKGSARSPGLRHVGRQAVLGKLGLISVIWYANVHLSSDQTDKKTMRQRPSQCWNRGHRCRQHRLRGISYGRRSLRGRRTCCSRHTTRLLD